MLMRKGGGKWRTMYRIRANAVLSSCDAFYDTYEIAETDGMYVKSEDRVGIWR